MGFPRRGTRQTKLCRLTGRKRRHSWFSARSPSFTTGTLRNRRFFSESLSMHALGFPWLMRSSPTPSRTMANLRKQSRKSSWQARWIRSRWGPIRWRGTCISALAGMTMLCELFSARSKSIQSLHQPIGAWALVGSKRANTRKQSPLFMVRTQNWKPPSCATPLPLVGLAATGNASWKLSCAKERRKIATDFLRLHAVTCVSENGRRPSRPWKRVTRCTIRILSFGFQFTRSSIPCVPIRVFKECFTVLAFRDCSAPVEEFFSAQIELYIAEGPAGEKDGETRFDLH